MPRICVYCGSNSGSRPIYSDAARALAEVLVRNGYELVYGGADKGIMGVIEFHATAGGQGTWCHANGAMRQGDRPPKADGTPHRVINARAENNDG